MTNLHFPRIVLACSWVLMALAYIAFALGLPATSLEASISATALFVVYSFLD